MNEPWIKIPLYIIIGATVISLFQSVNTAPAIASLTGGFANIIAAMTGKPQNAAAQSSNAQAQQG